ncbi:MAG: ArsA family ATPase [Thermodesulfovibrionales bacterium]|nr:ArsA family ATPase [Thermodesulfovibrionales bacterium]
MNSEDKVAIFFKKIIERHELNIVHSKTEVDLRPKGVLSEANVQNNEEVNPAPHRGARVNPAPHRGARVNPVPACRSRVKEEKLQLTEPDSDSNMPSFLKNEKLRLVIFGGKGGTGKTTSSCATAMYLSRKYPEKRFLVASSDPAHSLGDSFDCPVNSSVTPVTGVDNLWAIEMNSQALLEKFKEKYKSSIANLYNMSFNTDQIDIRDFLSFKLPGMQEMMILLEIVNLLKFGIFRPYEYDMVIWDTAPTGHTLRLLELPAKVLKWIELFETSFLRYKRVSIGVATLGFRIPGRLPPKGNVRTFLDTLSEDLEKIRVILKDAENCEFIPVTIPEELSIAETERLLATLKQEGIPVRNIIVNRLQKEKECTFCSTRRKGQESYLKEIDSKFASYNLLRLPVFPNEVRGKDGLLRFGEFLSGNSNQYSLTQSTSGPLRDEDNFQPGELREILNKELQFVIFGGKGGVGKTTVSAATAVSIARHNPGKKVLVFSTDPAHSLSDSFATLIGDTVTAIKVEGNLYALEIDGAGLYQDFRKEYKTNIEDTFKKWQNSHLAGGRKWKLDFDEKVMVEFVDTYPPGLEEVLALEKIMGFIENADFDIYIFDTAPTGHLVELLKFPELVREWLRITYRALLKYHREVPVDNIEVLAKKILASQETVQKMHAFLTNPEKSEFIAVTIPEAMGLLETEDLLLSIRDLGIPCKTILVNMLIPPTDCDFCRSKRNEQISYIQQIDEKTEYKGYRIAKVPLYPHEIRGINDLTKLSNFMYEKD